MSQSLVTLTELSITERESREEGCSGSPETGLHSPNLHEVTSTLPSRLDVETHLVRQGHSYHTRSGDASRTRCNPCERRAWRGPHVPPPQSLWQHQSGHAAGQGYPTSHGLVHLFLLPITLLSTEMVTGHAKPMSSTSPISVTVHTLARATAVRSISSTSTRSDVCISTRMRTRSYTLSMHLVRRSTISTTSGTNGITFLKY
jgi:hypothetical protein